MDAATLELLAAPVVAALLVISTHVVLGREVLSRGIIFIDLAMAQVAALGMLAAGLFSEEGGWHIWAGAVAAVLVAAFGLAWTERRLPTLQEPIIGCVYVLAASAALLLLAHDPHGSEHMNELLAGQLLWVDWDALWPVAILYAALLIVWFLYLRDIRPAFYFVFAFVVTAAVQMVGVLLVFATLILPALSVHGLSGKRAWLLAYAAAIVGYVAGLVLSAMFDLPAGPLIVCLLAVTALIVGVARRYGVAKN